jgi:hypothetical protein
MSAERTLLDFLARPDYRPMRLEAIVRALGGGKRELAQLRKVMPRLLKAGAA